MFRKGRLVLVKPACGGAACLALAAACFVVASLPDVPDDSAVYIATWIGGVVLGAAAIYLLVIAFPLRGDPVAVAKCTCECHNAVRRSAVEPPID